MTVSAVTEPARYAVGDIVVVMPAHLDPTVNLHERLLIFGDGTVTEWLIDLRRVGPLLADPLPLEVLD
jgi:D-serine deaminase-like pyridoxal phosphate-dependent protein